MRALTPADWEGLWPLLRGMGVNDESAATQRDRGRLILADPRWAVFGAYADGPLVGYAAAQDYGPHLRAGDDHRVARLHDVYVDPDHRRTGVGRALMAAVIAWARQHVRHLEWQAHQDRAAAFYERLGYRGDPCPQPDYPTFQVDFKDPPHVA